MTKLLKNLKPYLKVFLNNYMPRWIIFTIDLVIVAGAFITLWLIRDSLAASPINHFPVKICLALFVYTITSVTFKTYRGVVRFSSANDINSIMQSAIVASIFYATISFVANQMPSVSPHISFHLWFPFLHGLMVVGGQLMFRFTVRSIYEKIEESDYIPKKSRAIFLGTDKETVHLANYMIADRSSKFKPVAFISFNGKNGSNSSNGKNGSNTPQTANQNGNQTANQTANQNGNQNGNQNTNQTSKYIMGLPILRESGNITAYMEKHKSRTLLLTRNQLNLIPKEFYDRCIVQGLDIRIVNTTSRLKETPENLENLETSKLQPPKIDKIRIEDLLGRNVIEMDKEAIRNQFDGQNILITGAAGSIGAEIARQVVQFHCNKVILVDQAETPLNDLWLELTALNSGVEIKPVIANVSNKERMRQVFSCSQASLVFHAAAYKHVPMMEFHPSTAVVTNVLGTKNCADLALEYGVKRFVMVSTDKAVNPTNIMGATKRAAEIYIQSLALSNIANPNTTRFVTTRFGNVLGSNGSVVPLFKRQIENGGPITITHREITRYFMTIPEACSLVLEAGCMGNSGEIYIFDMGEAVKIYDLAEKMIRLAGKTPGTDIQIVEVGLRPGEKLYEELLATTENTLPTYHKKIMIAMVRKYSLTFIGPKIDKLIETALHYDTPSEVVRKLKLMIPEFKSINSQYCELDKELEEQKVLADIIPEYQFASQQQQQAQAN